MLNKVMIYYFNVCFLTITAAYFLSLQLQLSKLRNSITISFIILLFISQAGYFFIYAFRQHLLREEMETQLLGRIPESSLESIVPEAHSASLVWIEAGKEFRLNGELYDVAQTKKINGRVILLCIKDRKEQKLLQDFSSAQQAGSDQSKKESSRTVKFYPDDIIANGNDRSALPSVSLTIQHTVITTALCDAVTEVIPRPPQVDTLPCTPANLQA